MDRNELTLVVAGALGLAILLGWLIGAVAARLGGRAADLAARLAAAESAGRAAEARAAAAEARAAAAEADLAQLRAAAPASDAPGDAPGPA